MYVATSSLTKRYGDFTALDECSLGAERGEVFGLLGPNGAGKSTLLRILLGFLSPTSGTATIDTLDCTKETLLVKERVSYLPGEARLFRNLRGREVLQFFPKLRPGHSFEKANKLAKRLNLDTSKKVSAMSSGMRQKLALSVVLSSNAPLLILDEPTSYLDPNVRAEVLAIIQEAKDDGRTVIFSSHVLSEAESVCDRIAILKQGKHVHTQAMEKLSRQHIIRAKLTGEYHEPPQELKGLVTVERGHDAISIQTEADLNGIFGWLSTLPLAEVSIEPIGLKSVYEQFHPPQKNLTNNI